MTGDVVSTWLNAKKVGDPPNCDKGVLLKLNVIFMEIKLLKRQYCGGSEGLHIQILSSERNISTSFLLAKELHQFSLLLHCINGPFFLILYQKIPGLRSVVFLLYESLQW